MDGWMERQTRAVLDSSGSIGASSAETVAGAPYYPKMSLIFRKEFNQL
jgi:hypothetical protein